MPAMPMQTGPASPQLRSMSPWMLALLVVQTALCAYRIIVFLDIMGGFISAIGIGLGWYAWKEDMNITFICYWGMMCLINGALDFVKWLDMAVKSPLPVFSSSATTTYNVASAINLLIPLSVLAAAALAWRLYKIHKEGDALPSPGGGARYGYPAASGERGSLMADVGPRYTAFAGNGQRLGSRARAGLLGRGRLRIGAPVSTGAPPPLWTS